MVIGIKEARDVKNLEKRIKNLESSVCALFVAACVKNKHVNKSEMTELAQGFILSTCVNEAEVRSPDEQGFFEFLT